MRFLSILFGALSILVSCVPKSSRNEDVSIKDHPSDTVWIVSKGQHKTDVRNLFLTRKMEIKEDALSNSIFGIGVRSIHWLGVDWDLVQCRFNDDNRLYSVSIMRSGVFDNGNIVGDTVVNVVYQLQRIFGMAESISSRECQFINARHVNASMKQDRNTTILVIWE